jgi:proteasome lid subunit RPN8/RPN11
MPTQPENALTRWTVPACPFAIDYSSRVFDDIRLAVTDAFFSLPRGGAEIGGLLLGRQEKGGISVLDALPLECEHAFGPSFVLSPRDYEKLASQVAAANRNPNSKVVGWWHSHTRSEIFLSDQDLEIHNKFFPEPWQVALVLKPHTFQPTRAGFFFREKGGSIHASAPYAEIVLEPLPMRPVPAGGAPDPAPLFVHPRDAESRGPVVNVSAQSIPEPAEPEPPADPAPDPEPARDLPPPSFLAPAPEKSRSWAPWLAIALGLGLGAWGWQSRDLWWPRLHSTTSSGATEKLALSVIERDGQLQIHWNGAAPAALAATAGSLHIADGTAAPLTIDLGRPHILTGAFTYARKSDRVDITLVLPQPGGKEVREATLFAAAAPSAPIPPAAAIPAPEPSGESVEALKAEITRLQKDNAVQVERNRRLEKAMEELRKAVTRDEQRKRLEVQSPDAAK